MARGPATPYLGPDVPDFGRSRVLCERADAIKSERDLRRVRFSGKWRRDTRRAARLVARAARIRREALHEWTTRVVTAASDLTVVAPRVKESTASPRGDEKNWGAAVETVSALNRSTLGQAPALAIQMLEYKAKEAGIRCDVAEDEAPVIAVGGDLVIVGRLTRRARRKLRETRNAA